MRGTARVGELASLVVLCVACSSPATNKGAENSDGGSSDAGGETQAQAVGTQITDALCGNLDACCNAASQTVNAEICRDNVLRDANIDPADVMFYGAAVVSANAPACAVAATAYAKSCGDAVKKIAYLEACRRVFSGPLANGAACKGTLACAQPGGGVGFSYCEQVRVGMPQVCLVHLPPKVGASCVVALPSYADCTLDPALYCSSVTGTCKDKTSDGQPCDDTGGCVKGTYCGDKSTCHQQGTVGGNCGGYADGCATGVCSSTTKICVPDTKPAPTFTSQYCH